MADESTTIGRFSVLVQQITDDYDCELVDVESNNGLSHVSFNGVTFENNPWVADDIDRVTADA